MTVLVDTQGSVVVGRLKLPQQVARRGLLSGVLRLTLERRIRVDVRTFKWAVTCRKAKDWTVAGRRDLRK
jgi:hypothetical protein